jgi:hypothetical protein
VLVPDAAAVARRLRERFPTIGERWRPRLGVKTGADDVFLVAEPEEGTRPALRGRDVTPWRPEPRRHLLWTHGPDGRPLARLPAAMARRLAPHFARLERRADARGGAVPWAVFRPGLALVPHRVVWPDVARRLAAAVPPPEVVPLNTVYGIGTRTGDDALALAALLNTRWLTALARLGADPARGGYRRFNAGIVRALPAPPAGASVWTQLADCGRRTRPADPLLADVFELRPGERRALERLAPPSVDA